VSSFYVVFFLIFAHLALCAALILANPAAGPALAPNVLFEMLKFLLVRRRSFYEVHVTLEYYSFRSVL